MQLQLCCRKMLVVFLWMVMRLAQLEKYNVIIGESLVAQLINASSREQKGPGFESQRGQKS